MANSSEELLSPNTVHDPTATAATATHDSAVIDQLDSSDDLAAQSSRDEQDLAEDGGSLKRAHEEIIMAGGEYVLGLDDEQNAAKRQKLKEQAKKINNEQWDAMFERLVAYKEKHGDCLVPKRYAEDPKLGTWVETQRVQYKRLDRAVDLESGVETVAPNKRLNQERLEKLKAIGFAWTAKNVRKTVPGQDVGTAVTKPASVAGRPKRIVTEEAVAGLKATARPRVNDNQWEQMYQRLVEYREKHGNCLVPRKYEPDQKLATWVETQRVLWNRDYRDLSITATSANHAEFPESASACPTASVPMATTVEGRSAEEWATEIAKAERIDGAVHDAEAMREENFVDEAAQNAAVAAAVAAVAADALEMIPLEEQGKMRLNIPTKRLSQERKDKLDAIGFVWSLRNKRIEDHWDEMFRQLLEYKNQHGDCLVPSRYEANVKLGKWVETQRYEYTKLQRAANGGAAEVLEEPEPVNLQAKPRMTNPRLTEERLRRLESIGFEWKVKHKMKRYYDKQWDQMFERLLQFKETTGHCMVPKRFPQDVKLGTWVHTQRIQYRKMMSGKSSPDGNETGGEEPKSEDDVQFRLTDERRKRLEDIGFIWSARENEKGVEQGRIVRNSYDDQWDAMFNRLKGYKEKYGDCLVPKRFKEDQKLGTWVDTQRVQYKKMKKKLASEGLVYEGPTDADGDLSETEGTPAVSDKPVVGRLTDDRIRRLENLGFVWSLRDDWHKHFVELKAFKEEHGHCNVPARYSKNRRLGIWVSAQRQQYKNLQVLIGPKARRLARLTQDRIDLLNELGFTWTIRSRDSFSDSWNQRFQDLKEFKDEFGHCNVPSRYEPNPELGIWVGTQRTQYRLYLKAKETGDNSLVATSMTDERVQQLEELGFVWALRTGETKREPDFRDATVLEPEPFSTLGYVGDGMVANVRLDALDPMAPEVRMGQTEVS